RMELRRVVERTDRAGEGGLAGGAYAAADRRRSGVDSAAGRSRVCAESDVVETAVLRSSSAGVEPSNCCASRLPNPASRITKYPPLSKSRKVAPAGTGTSP